jgi:hypothetical protein
MNRNEWKDLSSCLGKDTELFFDKYEESLGVRSEVDSLCSSCPVRKECFAVGISQKESGVWGGVYLDNGKISREFNSHNSKADWAEKWKSLTLED